MVEKAFPIHLDARTALFKIGSAWTYQSTVNVEHVSVTAHSCMSSTHANHWRQSVKWYSVYYVDIIIMLQVPSPTAGVAPLTSLAPVTWAWFCMSIATYMSLRWLYGWGRHVLGSRCVSILLLSIRLHFALHFYTCNFPNFESIFTQNVSLDYAHCCCPIGCFPGLKTWYFL